MEGPAEAVDLVSWTMDINADGYRLPTEAEWEYAARGGLPDAIFPWGDDRDENLANYYGSPPPGSTNNKVRSSVGFYLPNGFGLYDMSGNVAECCGDRYAPGYYSATPAQDPIGPSAGDCRVRRGGSIQTIIDDLRCAARSFRAPTIPTGSIGLRPVWRQPPTANQ